MDAFQPQTVERVENRLTAPPQKIAELRPASFI